MEWNGRAGGCSFRPENKSRPEERSTFASTAWELISMSLSLIVVAMVMVVQLLFQLFLLLSALNFPAQPPWRICNAHFLCRCSLRFKLSSRFFPFFFFAFYQLKATSKAESVCVCRWHAYTKWGRGTQIPPTHTHTHILSDSHTDIHSSLCCQLAWFAGFLFVSRLLFYRPPEKPPATLLQWDKMENH